MINYEADPKFWQRFLEGAGFYKGDLDGDFGPQSHAATRQHSRRNLSESRKTQLRLICGRKETSSLFSPRRRKRPGRF